MKFFERHKWPAFKGIMIIADKACFAQLGKILYFPMLIVVISVFSFIYSALLNMLKKSFFAASFTADNKLFSNGNSITWNIVMGTGMT
ncbi:MAG: hypothetical protein KKC75_06650 [Nanoarchaeota archaeon]|nr:hypothetical protein [Nanoarchaeota archaeon]